MARKKGSKRARYFWGGRGGGSFGGVGFSQEAADNIKKGALLAQQDAKPAATKTVQPATGAKSARDFAPVVEGAGIAYEPTQKAAVMPSKSSDAINSGRASGVFSAGTMGAEGQSDSQIAKILGIEYTGDRDQDQMVQDKIQQFRQEANRAAGRELTEEEIQKGFADYADTIKKLEEDPAFREKWFGKRVHKSGIGKAIDKIGGPAGLFGLTVGALTGGLGYAGMLGSAGAGAAAGAGTAAIIGDDPLKA